MASPIKAGVKSSEFVLALLGMVVANVAASGYLVETHWVTQMVAAIGNFILPALYAVMRSKVKIANVMWPNHQTELASPAPSLDTTQEG